MKNVILNSVCKTVKTQLNVNLKSIPSITKDPEGIMGLNFHGCRITESTQEVQEILKAQAAILHVGRREDVTYPFPEGVGL